MIFGGIPSALLLVLLMQQQTFNHFRFCKENVRGPFETQCVQLAPDGTGEATFKRREAEEVQSTLEMSSSARDRFLKVLADTKYLANSDKYESNRRVADLGRKQLTLEMPSERREAEFNFSDIKEVNALVQFFEAVVNQQMLIFDIDTALQFERLSIPERLEQVERELKANRIADPRTLIPILEKVAQDTRVVNYARAHARRLREQIGKE